MILSIPTIGNITLCRVVLPVIVVSPFNEAVPDTDKLLAHWNWHYMCDWGCSKHSIGKWK